MNRSLMKPLRTAGFVLAFFSLSAKIDAQDRGSDHLPSIEGKVCDAQNHPLAGVSVTLESAIHDRPISTATDPQGHFVFSKLPAGVYTLSARLPGFGVATEGPVSVQEHEAKSVTLLLSRLQSGDSAKDSTADLPFSDETHFTVAGLTDTTSLGGHGSDPVRRNSDALSKDAARLANTDMRVVDEAAIRARLAKEDTADLHFQLAEIEEKAGDSLAAAKDYQRAAEMEPTEPYLFAWGAELLLHRAFDPSIEVFTKGRRLHPSSVRMVLGHGSAMYARGSTDEAKQIFLQACDVSPSDQRPYLFLGRVQKTESNLPAGWTDRLKRFVDLYPENAKAHYFYAVALGKQESRQRNLALVESQLKAAIDLDPGLGNAYLELGILASAEGDLPQAIALLQKAVENTPLPDEAHYRLAQLYRRMGDADKARRESELYKQVSEQKNQQVERERHELQQFVYTLRGQAPSRDPSTDPH
jgi:tetratricopeptide (TPR) repeat protein